MPVYDTWKQQKTIGIHTKRKPIHPVINNIKKRKKKVYTYAFLISAFDAVRGTSKIR